MKGFRNKKETSGVTGRLIAIALFLALLASSIWAALALAAGAPIISGTAVSHIGDTSARFEATLNPNEREVKAWFFEYAGEASFKAKGFEGASKTPAEKLPAGKEGVPVSAQVSGLSPGTTYHFRLFAQNQAGKTEGPALAFTTYVTPEPFEPCPNDAFRTGQPSAQLPDCRAYEQASPVDKNGGDVTGTRFITRASANGDRVIFEAASPIPGGEGAQEFNPIYLAGREGGAWSTQGVQPPQREGQETTLTGWTPDLSYTFSWVKRYGAPSATALLERSLADRSVTTVLPHTAAAHRPKVAGSSEDGSIVFFEHGGRERGGPLTANATAAGPNLYVWDRETNTVRLAGVLNDGTAPPAGSFAGPYGWTQHHAQLSFGGVDYFHYVSDLNAIAPDGSSVYFTAARTGQLYLRLNPAKPQSPLDGEGDCTDPSLACTIHVSATEKDNGPEGGPDPAGPHPAAFMGASRDGSVAYFTSSEKLTDDANTGPEQPLPRIGRAKVGGEKAEELEESFLAKKHAVGVAVDPKGEYLYWADPSLGTIGRAKITGGEPTEVKDEFIVPGETSFEARPQKEPGIITSGPSAPRYVAVDGEYLYWTNTGPLFDDGAGPAPWEEGGTIGRAKLNGTEPPSQGDIEPEFITGASDPQGIAVDSEHIYWANGEAEGGLEIKGPAHWISRATIDGVQVEPEFALSGLQGFPQALTLSGNHLYYSVFNSSDQQGGHLLSYPLQGGEPYAIAHLRISPRVYGIAADGAEVYWSEGSGGIGRVTDNGGRVEGFCNENPGCEMGYLKPEGSLNGLALDGTRLYWGANGEGGSNPGNDLYRYEVKTGNLTDLAPDSGPGAEDGAEAKGVLGASQDGSYLYFVANGALAAGAVPGNCHGTAFDATSGECNLYLAHEGRLEFIARLNGKDNDDWRGADVPDNGSLSFVPRLARVSADGRALLFTSTQKLSAYQNEGKPELYLFRAGAPERIICVSCSPTGLGPSGPPSLGSEYPGFIGEVPAPVMSRNLSADGRRVFFESPEALLAADVNGAEGCPLSENLRKCQDVYEWEAKGAGSCHSEAQNGGCLYLISSGTSSDPSVLIDASRSGDDVFFFTRSALVGQDADSFVDVYDARVGGGLASQSRATPLPPCEGEACKGGVTPPPLAGSPATPLVSGPPDPKPKHKKPKKHHKKHHKKHQKHHKKHKRGADNKGRAGR